MKYREKKFYEALEEIFTGVNIEGSGGIVNLLKTKYQYYKLALKKFQEEINNDSIIVEDFREEFFEKLHSFFENYFSESGSVYFVKTADYQKVFEKVYTNEKDVVMFYKTHMLYYIKSEIVYKNAAIQIENVNFQFNVEKLEINKPNEKHDVSFIFTKLDKANPKYKEPVYIFEVLGGGKTNYNDIVKLTNLPEHTLQRAFNQFLKQTKIDLFINKNAETFLKEQLDLYLHQILLNEDNTFQQDRLNQLKTIKKYALKLIKFISQFENELVKIWNKPKFVKDSNYIISIDKLSKINYDRVKNHKNINKQINEWKELNLIKTDIKHEDILSNYRYLPVDTKFFKDIEYHILKQFSNLDEEIDGRMICSENYQALNSLKNKYRSNIQCIYIDPPYNTGSDGFTYIDKFQKSSWLSLLYDRLVLAKEMLSDNGSIFVSIGDTFKSKNVSNSNAKLQMLMSDIFNEDNYIANFIRKSSSAPKLDAKFVSNAHDFVIAFAKDINKLLFNKNSDVLSGYDKKDNHFNERGKYKLNDLDRGSIRYSKSLDFPIMYKGQTYWPGGCEKDTKSTWRWNKEHVEWGIKNDFLVFTKNKVKFKQYEFVNNWNKPIKRENPYNTFISNIYNEQGNKEILNMFDQRMFEYPKPSELSQYIFELATEKDSLVLDFFGGSASTIEGLFNINKTDNGNRKFILVENNQEIFNTVAIPRIKKLIFSNEWKKGNPLDVDGHSKFIKYYSFEQYEETLANMKYKDYSSKDLFSKSKNTFEEYIFYSDEKFANVLNKSKKNKYNINFKDLFANIDFPETISLLYGGKISEISETSFVLKINNYTKTFHYNYKDMNDRDKVSFIKIIKPLLWWGS